MSICKYVFLILLSLCLTATKHVCWAQPEAFSASQKGAENSGVADSTAIKAEYRKKLRQAEQLKEAGHLEEAIICYHDALALPQLSNEDKMHCYSFLSNIYQEYELYDQALEMNLKAQRFTAKAGMLARLKVNASHIHMNILNFEKALDLQNEAMKVFELERDTMAISRCLSARARVYTLSGIYDSAITNYRQALQWSRLMSYTEGLKEQKKKQYMNSMASTINNIADVFIRIQQPDSALYYLDETRPYFYQIERYNQAVINTSFGEAYALQGKTEKAMAHFRQGLEVAESSGFQNIRRTAYKAMSDLYASQKAFYPAWDFLRKYQELYENVISASNIHKINHLQSQYVLERKDKELFQKELQLTNNRLALVRSKNTLYLSILAATSILLVLIVAFRNLRNKQRLLKERVQHAEQLRKLTQAEATLQGEENERERIAHELHDSVMSEIMAFNLSLAALADKGSDQDQKKEIKSLQQHCVQIAENLRSTAHNLMPHRIRESGLIQSVAAFLKRVNSSKISFRFEHYGAVLRMPDITEKIIFQVIQELVQNIVKHSRATEAYVELMYHDDSLTLTVEDNGTGIGKRHTQSEGMGWENIRKQIALIEGCIDIQSSEYTGTTVFIEIPHNNPTLL